MQESGGVDTAGSGHRVELLKDCERSPEDHAVAASTFGAHHSPGPSYTTLADATLCEFLLDRWRTVLGPDDADTLTVASRLALALFGLGEVKPSRALSGDTLQRCRRALGPDHPATLSAGAVLTVTLVELREAKVARALGEDTLQR